MTSHSSHPDIFKRLKKAHGHLASIVGMLEEGRGCLELAQQLHAVEKAVANAKKKLVHDHLDHCLDQAMDADAKTARASAKEFKEITKYL